MNIRKLALIALLGSALAAMGCGNDDNGGGGEGGTGGTGGGGGAGGTAGMGGMGGSGGVTPPDCGETNCVFCPPESLPLQLLVLAPNGIQFGVPSSATSDGVIDEGQIFATLEGLVEIDLSDAFPTLETLPISIDADTSVSYSVGGTGTADNIQVPIPEEEIIVTPEDPVLMVAIGPSEDNDVMTDTPEGVTFDLAEFVLNATADAGTFGMFPLVFTAGLDGSNCILQGEGFDITIDAPQL